MEERERKLKRIRALVRIRWVERRFIKKIGSQYYSYLQDRNNEWYGKPKNNKSLYVSLDELKDKNIKRFVTSSLDDFMILTLDDDVPNDLKQLENIPDGKYLLTILSKSVLEDIDQCLLEKIASILSVDRLIEHIKIHQIYVTPYVLEDQYEGYLYIKISFDDDVFVIKTRYKFSFPVLSTEDYLSKRLGSLTKECSIYKELYDKTDKPKKQIPPKIFKEVIDQILKMA